MKTLKQILITLAFYGTLTAQTVESVSADPLFTHTYATSESVDTSITDTLPDPHQMAMDANKKNKEKTKLIKRTFDARQQVSLGIGMMIFIALIMTTAQSWNPKN